MDRQREARSGRRDRPKADLVTVGRFSQEGEPSRRGIKCTLASTAAKRRLKPRASPAVRQIRLGTDCRSCAACDARSAKRCRSGARETATSRFYAFAIVTRAEVSHFADGHFINFDRGRMTHLRLTWHPANRRRFQTSSLRAGYNGADGGTRTPTPIRGADFHATSTFAAASSAFVVWTIPSP